MSHIINAVTVTATDSENFNTLLAEGLNIGKSAIVKRGYDIRNMTEDVQYQTLLVNNSTIVYTALITWREKL